MTFVTSFSDLLIAIKHKTITSKVNDKGCFTEDVGKYKVTKSKQPIYVTALSASAFTQNFISVEQFASKHDMVFNKTSCYLRGPTLPLFMLNKLPLEAQTICIEQTIHSFTTILLGKQ